MADAHKNFAISSVATAPSPATTGNTITVTAGQATRFPTPPFNATISPSGSEPDPTNAEIVRVTAVNTSTNVLTVTRQQEGTAARTIVVGDVIRAGPTAKTFTDIETAVVGTGNYYFITGLLANGSDEGASLNTKIAASPAGSTVVFPSGIIGTSVPIKLLADRSYIGTGAAYGYVGTVIKQVNGAAITTAVVGSAAYLDNSTVAGNPIVIDNICVDVNSGNCPSSTAHGIAIVNFWSHIRNCLIYGAKRDGIYVGDTTANGSYITGSCSENKIYGNRVDGTGQVGIHVVSNAFAGPLDGFMIDNLITNTTAEAIRIDRAGGWKIKGNHTYGAGTDAISCDGGFATIITDNYVEDFGTNNAATSYAGIFVGSIYDGPGVIIANNTVNSFSNPANATGMYFILALSGSGQTNPLVTITGNLALGNNKTTEIGIRVNATGSTKLTVRETGNIVSNIGGTAGSKAGTIVVAGSVIV